MTEAIQMVREKKKMGYFKAAKHFDVPRTTLFQLCLKNELSPEEAAATALGRKPVLGLKSGSKQDTQVIGHKGKRQIASLTSAETGSLMTIVISMNVTSRFVPPYIIFLKKNMSEQLMRGSPAGHWPLNKNIFSEIDYLAAQQDAVKDGRTINATPTKSSSHFAPRQDAEFDPEPSTSGLARRTLNLVSAYDISPMPDKKKSNRGRKGSIVDIITSSYKNQLIDINKIKEEKENKLSKLKNKIQKEKK
ncbi:hypothetical protein EVAR_68608_1 [Eumeta japonica]|uniref:HTH psq-type domain-containing protein n=1 Tax=Eumeta variegata TaxID=151549 RepID=A0A4C1ZLD1_EUMVA|nr:hypothetical protein EVAR_68608_1 [Eumeta japonica]